MQYCFKLISYLIEQELVEQYSRSFLLDFCESLHALWIFSTAFGLLFFHPLSFFSGHFSTYTGTPNIQTHAWHTQKRARAHTHTISLAHSLYTIVVGKATWYLLHSWIFIHTCFRQKVFSRFHCCWGRSLDRSSFVYCGYVCDVLTTQLLSHLIGKPSLFLYAILSIIFYLYTKVICFST